MKKVLSEIREEFDNNNINERNSNYQKLIDQYKLEKQKYDSNQ